MRSKVLVVSLISALFIGLFVQYQIRSPRRNYSDYSCFYKAGKDILQGKNPYIKEIQEISDYKYPLIFAVFMAGLAIFDLKTSASIYFILNFLAAILIFVFSWKVIHFRRISSNKMFSLFLIVLLINFRFILNCLHCGQVGLFIALSLVLGVYFISKGKEIIGSFFIGFAAMIKYMAVLFIPYFFVKRKYNLTILIVFSILVYCLLPGLFIGLKANSLLLKELLPYIGSSSLGEGFISNTKSQSFWTLPIRFYPNISTLVSISVTMIIFAILSFFIIINNRKNENNRNIIFNNCVDYAMVFILIPLFNPYGWIHNYVTLIFSTMLVVYYLFVCNFKDKAVLCLLVIYLILSNIGSPALVGRGIQMILESFPILVFSMLFIFGALVKIKFRSAIYNS